MLSSGSAADVWRSCTVVGGQLSRDGPWSVGLVEEVPGVNAQERRREKLLDSLRLVLREALELNRKEGRQAAGASYEELAFTL